MVWVAPSDAAAYCAWAFSGGRLPSDFEWQYAAQVRACGHACVRVLLTWCVIYQVDLFPSRRLAQLVRSTHSIRGAMQRVTPLHVLPWTRRRLLALLIL